MHVDRECGVERLVLELEGHGVAVLEGDAVGNALGRGPLVRVGELTVADVDAGDPPAAVLGDLDRGCSGTAADVQQVLVRP